MIRKTFDVVLASDTAYLPWCATAMLSSLQTTAEHDVRFHLLHEGGVGDHDLRRLAAMVEAHGGRLRPHLIEPDRVSSLPTKGDAMGGRISWSRVLVPDLLGDVDLAMYLDADTLVTASLDELFATDLGGYPLGAVRNVVEPAMREYVRRFGLEPHDYFNAGVLLMNLRALRDENALGKIHAFVAGHDANLVWFDQDALNVVFEGRWLPLAPRWNAQNSFWSWRGWAEEVHGERALQEAVERPAVLHFEGPPICKPWHYLSTHPFRQRYRQTLELTPWRGQGLLGRSVPNRLIARLPESRWVPARLQVERLQARLVRARRTARAAMRR